MFIKVKIMGVLIEKGCNEKMKTKLILSCDDYLGTTEITDYDF
jgi:hypothetical protein